MILLVSTSIGSIWAYNISEWKIESNEPFYETNNLLFHEFKISSFEFTNLTFFLSKSILLFSSSNGTIYCYSYTFESKTKELSLVPNKS